MSPIDSYRHLFGLTGRTYIVVAFLARMPLAMSQLGTLLLVSAATGSYGAGGFCAGALAVANAVGAPFWGARADRLGQRRVVALQSARRAASASSASSSSWPPDSLGASPRSRVRSRVCSCRRSVRWLGCAGGPITAATGSRQHRLVDAAFSYEGAADEASFVLGPALVGLGVSVASPTAALALAAAGLTVFGTWFALHETADGDARGDRRGRPAPWARC